MTRLRPLFLLSMLVAVAGCSDAAAPRMPEPEPSEEPRDSVPQQALLIGSLHYS